MSEAILVDIDRRVATVRLNRPERRNAFTPEVTNQLFDAFARLEADDEVRAIVVTGVGDYFSAGADLGSGPKRFAREPKAFEEEQRRAAARIKPWLMSTPIIAAMNGSAVGMGLTLTMNWDIRLMAEDAKYGFVFPRRGIIADLNSLWSVPRAVGLGRCADLLLTGRLFSGREGAARGLAIEALPAKEVYPAALEIAHDIATNTAPLSVALTKKYLHHMSIEPDRVASELEVREVLFWLGGQVDAAEGIQSFLERREPRWSLSKRMPLPGHLRDIDASGPVCPHCGGKVSGGGRAS
ncbi:MAG: enoyl-CoA hydratase-related protein [Burkholderiaceae bacterium]